MLLDNGADSADTKFSTKSCDKENTETAMYEKEHGQDNDGGAKDPAAWLDTQSSLGTSAFESQEYRTSRLDSGGASSREVEQIEQARQSRSGGEIERVDREPVSTTAKSTSPSGMAAQKHSMRLRARKEAYRAAKKCLMESDPGGWDDLNLRSVGRKGHSEAETEL